MRPAVTATTEAVYARMPQAYRDRDPAGDWACLRFISLLAEELDPTRAALDRIDWDWLSATSDAPWGDGVWGDGVWGDSSASSSDLFSAARADDGWLDWAIQRVGLRPPTGNDPARKRAVLADATARTHRGTSVAISRVVVDEWPLAAPAVARHWRGNPWHAVVVTTETGTPPTGDFITTLDELGDTFPVLDDLYASVPTMADLATIDRIHLDVAAAARAEEPAGLRLFHLWASTVTAVLPAASGAGMAGPLLAGGIGEAA